MSEKYRNPFEFDAAANLPLDMIDKVYIEDHNYSRFILSNRNVFLLGERGSGKSMMLIYNSFKIQKVRSKDLNGNKFNYDFVGIHVACKRPLFNKTEYELIENKDKASMLSEHYLVLAILYSIADELDSSAEIKNAINNDEFYDDFEYIIGESLVRKENCLQSLKMFSQRKINQVEQSGRNLEDIMSDMQVYSFNSLIIPVLNLFKNVSLLSNAHFMIMIDDAHDLNEYQIKKVNSWVSFRDHSLFSIKVATADVYKHKMMTDFGGCIVDGHDFISVNMEKSFQNPLSPFYKLAKDIIDRRLSLLGISADAESFFPPNDSLVKDLKACKNLIQDKAIAENPQFTTKQLNDYVYKRSRVEYFRRRSAKANRPPYSGFDILVHASTGVIRNLLAPCYAMYDSAFSEKNQVVNFIPPSIQETVLLEYSEKIWTKLRENRLSEELIECSESNAISIRNFFECLGDLFTERMKRHDSEPRVLTFTISGMSEEYRRIIEPTFNIARRTLLLYERSGPAKDSGRRETYYVPNRMLWLARGLDPVGQHGRVSLQAKDIVAAFNGKSFPYTVDEKSSFVQQEIGFDD